MLVPSGVSVGPSCHGLQAGARHGVTPGGDELSDERLGESIPRRLVQPSCHHFPRVDRQVQSVAVELLLAAEVVVEQTRVHLGRGGDRPQGGVAIATLAELLPGSVQDPLASLRRARTPTRLGHESSSVEAAGRAQYRRPVALVDQPFLDWPGG